MFTVKTLNKISNVGLSKFDEAKYTIDTVRSHLTQLW